MWKKLNVDMAEEWLMLSEEILNPETLKLKVSVRIRVFRPGKQSIRTHPSTGFEQVGQNEGLELGHFCLSRG